MASQLELLKAKLPKLEAEFGAGNPYVQGLKMRLAMLEKPRSENPMDNSTRLSVGMRAAPSTDQDDPNRPETEEDGLRAGALRLLKARHQSQAIRDRTLELSRSPSNTPGTTASGSPGKDPSQT